ncbi:hypothetical protein ACHRVW_16935 [Flavobacterium collinsii]|uniref:hypothetical protein n=1 Tax=Flavobacterium collinsii TaxID=1114861 RepID=UPI00375691BB
MKKLYFSLLLITIFNTFTSAQIYVTIQGASGSNNVGIGTNVPSQKLDVSGITKTIGLNSITITGRRFVFGASGIAQNYGVFQKNDGTPLVYILAMQMVLP